MKKKIFTLLGLSLLGTASVQAQLAQQNFNAGIPSSWSMIKGDSYTPSTQWVAAIRTKLTTDAWMAWPRAAGDSAVLTTSKFTGASEQADRWLISPSFTVNGANAVLVWEDETAYDGSQADNLQIWVSPTAGTTASSFTTKIYDQPGISTAFVKRGISLSAYNGQNIRVAFRNNSTNKGIILVDNIGTELMTNSVDAELSALSFPTLAAGSNPVQVTVKNNGAQTITSLTITYKIDNGTPVSQNFTGLTLTAYGTTQLTFSTQVSGLSTGGHTIQADITQTNGAADPIASNNSKSRAFAVPGAAVTRAGLIEEFTSSTCGPCAAFNVTFDPLILSNNANVPSSNFNIVKYQMNWPSPGTDASYNNDGYRRRVFYGVTGIPDHFTNGAQGGNGNQAEIDASKTKSAYLTIEGSYFVKSDSIFATIKLTPNFTFTNANFKLYASATEDHYTNNAATTSQKEYYHVMRKMLPSGDGTTVANWTSGQQQTYNFAAKYVNGNVTQMSNNFWISPRSGNLIVYVQDNETGEILQSKSIPAQWATGVGQVTTVNDIRLFPNPASATARLSFTNTEKGQVSVSVTDVAGRTVATVADGIMSVGAQTVDINTSTLAAGVYNVVIRTERGQTAERLSVVK